jgi:hypothetical protein
MSGILFLLAVAAFVIVVHWAYSNDRGPNAGATGFLAMTGGGEGEPTSAAPGPATWKHSRQPQSRAPTEQAEAPRASGSLPRWRQEQGRARWPR